MGQGLPVALRLLCPAKINLHLRVGRRRDDGFHPLLTWMCTVGLFDTLTLQTTPGARPSSDEAGAEAAALVLETDAPGLPCDQRNLVVRLAAAWGAEFFAPDAVAAQAPAHGRPAATRRGGRDGFFPVRAVLEKRIPVGSGLGGGSSDAARTLLGLERLRRQWRAAHAEVGDGPGGAQAAAENRRPANDLSAFAGRFGSDVPFFVRAGFPPPEGGPSAVCTGRGEIVTPVGPPAARWAVLVLPGLALSTADVYRRFDEMGLGRDEDVDARGLAHWPGWSGLSAKDLLPRLVNDLEPAAFSLRPDLADLREAAQRAGGRTVRMSGSGSSLFTLFDAPDDAEAAAGTVREMTGVRAEAVGLAPRLDDDLNVNDAGPSL